MRKYVHRVGRTARAGREGTAWTLIEKQEARRFKGILKGASHEQNVKKVKVKEEDLEQYQESYKVCLSAATSGQGLTFRSRWSGSASIIVKPDVDVSRLIWYNWVWQSLMLRCWCLFYWRNRRKHLSPFPQYGSRSYIACSLFLFQARLHAFQHSSYRLDWHYYQLVSSPKLTFGGPHQPHPPYRPVPFFQPLLSCFFVFPGSRSRSIDVRESDRVCQLRYRREGVLERGDDGDELGCAGIEDLDCVAGGEELELSAYWTWRDPRRLTKAHFVMVIIYQRMS